MASSINGNVPGRQLGDSEDRAATGLIRMLPVIVLAALASMLAISPSFVVTWGVYLAAGIFLTTFFLGGKTGKPELLAALLFGWSLLTVFWADVPRASTSAVVVLAISLVFFFAYRLHSTTWNSMALIIVGYVVGTIVVVVELILNSRVSLQDMLQSVLSWAVLTTGENDVERFSLGGTNFNYLSYTFCAAAALAMILAITARRRWPFVILAVVQLVLALFGLTLTGTRGAVYGIVALIVWVAIAWIAPKFCFWSLLAIVAVAQVRITVGVGTDVVDRLEGARATGTLSGRTDIWAKAKELWLESPVLGSGQGANQAIYGVEAHNAVLNALAGTGVVGCGLLLIFWWTCLRGSSFSPKRYLAIGCFVASTAPAYLTGAWDVLIPSWVSLAIVSNLDQIVREMKNGHRRKCGAEVDAIRR